LNTVVKACRLDKRGILKIFLIGESIDGRMASLGRAEDESNDKLGVMDERRMEIGSRAFLLVLQTPGQ
jgi:hypothetical protein